MNRSTQHLFFEAGMEEAMAMAKMTLERRPCAAKTAGETARPNPRADKKKRRPP